MYKETFIDLELNNKFKGKHFDIFCKLMVVICFVFQWYVHRGDKSWNMYPILIFLAVILLLFSIFSESTPDNYIHAKKTGIYIRKKYWLWDKHLNWTKVNTIKQYGDHLIIQLKNDKVYKFSSLNIKEEQITDLIETFTIYKDKQ